MNLFFAVSKAMDEDIPNPEIFYDILELLDPELEPIEPNVIIDVFRGATALDDIHLGNIHLHFLFSMIIDALEKIGIEADCHINCIDSHLYIFGLPVKSVSEFKKVLKNNSVVLEA